MKAVLLIEDDNELRGMIAALLRQNGWNVIEAEDGEAGISLARQHRPDIVVCDLLMPRCNGYQVCRVIRATPDLRDTKIVMISGRGYSTDKMNALEAGADEYMVKPVQPNDLRSVLRKLTAETFPTEMQARPSTVGAEWDSEAEVLGCARLHRVAGAGHGFLRRQYVVRRSAR